MGLFYLLTLYCYVRAAGEETRAEVWQVYVDAQAREIYAVGSGGTEEEVALALDATSTPVHH